MIQNKTLEQYTTANPQLYCTRCGRKLIASNPKMKGLCNQCVADDEIKELNIIRVS
jgi:NMD protein affecting ribosome stability and mRNA decay